MFRLAIVLGLICSAAGFADPIGPMPVGDASNSVAAKTGTEGQLETQPVGEPSGVGAARSERPLGTVPENSAASGSQGAQTPVGATGWLTSTALPLLGVLLLITGLAWVYRRFARTQSGLSSALGAGGRAPSGVLSVLGRFPVGGGVTLVLLQLDRRVLLASLSAGSAFRGRPGSMNLLTEITDEESVASLLVQTQDERGESMSQRFNELLQGYSGEEEAIEPASVGAGTSHLVDGFADEPVGSAATATRSAPMGEISPLRRRLERLMRNAQAEQAGS